MFEGQNCKIKMVTPTHAHRDMHVVMFGTNTTSERLV